MDEVIQQFTVLLDEGQFEKAYNLIRDAIFDKKMDDPELRWRHSRICRDMAMNIGKHDKQLYRKYVEEGLQTAEQGLKLDPKHPNCHSWCAIHLNYLSQLEGINKRIENSFKMKEHWLKAIEVIPDDAVTLHALGRWFFVYFNEFLDFRCYEVADLSWIKRKFAQTFFSTPPTSTFEEGLNYLLASEKASPNLIAYNSLLLAKTYQKLKKPDLAKDYCSRVLNFSATDLETEEAKKEATELLKSL